MNAFTRSIFPAVLAVSCAQTLPAQDFSVAQQADVAIAIENAKRQATEIREKVATMNLKELSEIDGKVAPELAGVSTKLAMLSATTFGLQVKRVTYGDNAYDSGTRALDDRRYDEAIQKFNAVVDAKSPRADGALYWKAYALNRLGRRDEALAAVAVLRRDYPQSHWLNDAQALEVEVKQGSGQAVSPADETNEELKLMAIHSLMNADPDRAIPLLENLLKGNSSPRVKDRAMFVLTQSKAPRAHQVLTDYAKGAGNPDLQIRAIRYIGMSGTAEAQQQLASVYSSSSDVAVKREIMRGLMAARGRDPLFNLAKTEKDPELRLEAVRQLGAMKATDQLMQLYNSETSADNKLQIVHSLFASGASDKLLEIAKSEKDPKVKTEAIRHVAMSRSTPIDVLSQLYSSDSDPKTKRELINGLHARGDAKALVDLAKKESDPAMKKYIVERLSTMQSKDATDYMVELLK
jgi:tetratricopeptide (TPR) repeat protein